MTTPTLGIDGASVAGIADCGALAALGYRFGFPRLSFGLAPDPACGEYLLRLKGAGMLARPYAYLRSWEDPVLQADSAVALARGFGQPFLWVDCEPARPQRPDGSWPRPSDAPAVARGQLLAWLDRASLLGLPVGVYGGAWYLAQLRLPPSVAALPLWVAHYGVAAPRVPAPWASCAVWQREGDVALAGAKVDLDESALSVEQLDRLLGGERDTPVTGEPLPYELLGGAVEWSDAASGVDGSVERFVDRSEGPDIDPIV